MTTTLRPAGPEERGPDDFRARDFTVCVNSRPVGTIRLATDERFGPAHGRIVSLAVDPPDRRRGRGCVAALTAEEVLRGWGCRQVWASVPADDAIALRLAASLGYTERNRTMGKPLTGPPPPADAALRPMTAREFPAWSERARAEYAASWEDQGLSRRRAQAKAEADHAAALPGGPATPGTALRVLTLDGTDAGWLWLRLRDESRPATPGWVMSVEVAEGHRGRGLGRRLMLAAERECLAAGVAGLELNVFPGNTPALRLYGALGYRTTVHHLAKALL